MSKLTTWLDRWAYPEFQNNWDDELLRSEILGHLDDKTSCLDFGAGRGNVSAMNFREQGARVSGVDVSPAVLENPYLDSAQVMNGSLLPFESESFDLVFSDNVLEHLDDPVSIFKEIYRVLKPGGIFIAKTPNKYHYMPAIARITPTWFHRLYNKWRGRATEDTFPTRYRANSQADLRSQALLAGFSVSSISSIEGRPEYLRMTFPTYLCGLLYERAVNSFEFLSRFRCILIIKMERRKD